MLVVVARIPAGNDASKRAAQLTGLAPADIARRLAGNLPRVLLNTEPTQASTLASGLEQLGFSAFACDAKAAPGDDERIIARALQLDAGGFIAIDGKGTQHACPAQAIVVFQRGVRVTRQTETVKSSERRFDAGRAILSGGLMLTKKVEKTTIKTNQAQEPFVLVQRGDGAPDVMLYERQIDYRFLGLQMQPSSLANLGVLTTRLRTLAPHAPFDDRVARPGFVSSLPLVSVDPVDLGLFLVSLARTRER